MFFLLIGLPLIVGVCAGGIYSIVKFVKEKLSNMDQSDEYDNGSDCDK